MNYALRESALPERCGLILINASTAALGEGGFNLCGSAAVTQSFGDTPITGLTRRVKEVAIMTFRDKAWSPYAAGVLIGLLQIPAFLLIDTALGTSSSYVTIAAHIAAFADASINKMEYLAKHMYGAKNLWQVAMVVGIAIGAFMSMKASGARRQAISPVWKKAVGLHQ